MGQTSQLFDGATPPETAEEKVGLPFAFVMERPAKKLDFLPDLREHLLPSVEPGKANPRLILAK